MKQVLVVLMCFVPLGQPAAAQTQPAANQRDQTTNRMAIPTPDPRSFANSAASGNHFEITTAKIALERSTQTDVRSFAVQLVEDHTKAQAELRNAATAQGIDVEISLNEREQDQVEALRNAPDNQFDAVFLSLQAVSHQRALDLHEVYGKQGDKGALKAHARAQLSTLRSHLVHAESAARR